MTNKIEEIRKAMEGATPGPWAVEYKHDTTRLIAGGECTMCDETYYPWAPYNDGDWHLIALAPDMARIVLAANEAIAASEVIARRLSHIVGKEMILDNWEAKRAAYRKAVEGGE